METLHTRVESWIRDQRTKILSVTWPPPWSMVVKWPWKNDHREQEKKIQEELERRKRQLQEFCHAVKAESISDLKEILCCMVLSECVYKRPPAEMLRAVNKFKSDFGGEIVSLERVQPSSDHVLHRYLLAEAGDTLYASFIGTKQYKDLMADANIFQGAIFHEEAMVDLKGIELDSEMNNGENDQINFPLKPAVHRGFMSRAKGIPALELYRLAQKKRQKLVLCGHSLGGAVAVLATLAILRIIAAVSYPKEFERVQVKCITFSQPPVGNAALRDYVNGKGWQHYFKTYCIPEDLVPRILSPAYFHHYDTQLKSKVKENEQEELVLGVGPVQNSFWRLSRLVPLQGLQTQFYKYKRRKTETSVLTDSEVKSSSIDDNRATTSPQSLEIEEGSDGISLRPFPEKISQGVKNGKSSGKKRAWKRIPSLPSYVPFGQLYLLGNSSVESLSGSEYSKLTSVRSVIAEVRERFQSHSMKSYRSRFQRMYELFMSDNKELQFPHLQKWLGISPVGGTVELGPIVESPIIRAATSLVPLGWNKNDDPIKVDISGVGLHQCTSVQVRVNGNWCSTTVESFPSPPPYHEVQPEMQKIRTLVGPPLRRPPKHQLVGERLMPVCDLNTSNEHPEGINDFVVFCTTDFSTVAKEVHIRTRRVRLIGLEGAGKTSLLKAILDQGRTSNTSNFETFQMDVDVDVDVDVKEGIVGGLLYSDSTGVNLQNLSVEASHFRDELWKGIRDVNKKIDLVVLVHNLSHRVPRSGQPNAPPALSLLLDEAKSLGVPWVLAITNKFSVSAHLQKEAIHSVLQAYQASPNTIQVINSCPYVIPSTDTITNVGIQKLKFARFDLVTRPFQRKPAVLSVEGVTDLCQLVHHVLRGKEEDALQELARDRIFLELVRERGISSQDAQSQSNSLTAATIGASVGAGVGIVLAVVMGAASALRKP